MPFNKAKAVDAANKAIKRGQYSKAVAEYQRIVRQDPEDTRSKLKLGDIYIRAGQTEAAVDILRETAEHYSQEGFTLKAVAVYKQILKLSPDLPDVSTSLASLYHQQGLLNDAVRQYKDAARILGQRGMLFERLDVIRDMLELDPENVSDRIRLGEAYSGAGRYNEAVTLFREACRTLERRDRPQLYCKVAERLLHHQPDDFEINRQLAAYYLKDRDAQRALPKLRACYRQQARDLDVLEMLQETFELLGQPHKAVSVLREMARIHEENGLLKERDQLYERILMLNSADSEARKALHIATAVDETSLVLEFDESGAGVSPDGLDDDTDDETFEEVDLEDDDLFAEEEIVEKDAPEVAAAREAAIPQVPAQAAKPKRVAAPRPRVRQPADTERDVTAGARVAADDAAAALEAVRRGDVSLDEIFGDLDLDEEIDIQDEGEDTIVVGDLAIEDFDEFEFDDDLEKASPLGGVRSPSRPTGAKSGGGGLQDDWRALFSDDRGAASSGDRQDAFGRVDDEVDLQQLMVEAERAVVDGAKQRRAGGASAGMDVALRESLEEVDFYVTNELHEDAVQLLQELQAEYPEHPEIMRRLQSLGQ